MVLNRMPVCFSITVCFYEESSVVQKKEVNSSLELVLGHLLSSGVIITAYRYVAESCSFSLLIYWLKKLWSIYKNRRANLFSCSSGTFTSYPFLTKKERWIGIFGVLFFVFVKPLTRTSLTAEILYSFVRCCPWQRRDSWGILFCQHHLIDWHFHHLWMMPGLRWRQVKKNIK